MPTTAEALPFVERVRDLLATLARAQRDYITYPRNNPIRLRRRDELMEKFTALLAGWPELMLVVEAEELLFEKATVYRNPDRRESIAFQLYRHGIRQVRFSQGLTLAEIEDLIGAVNTEFAGDDLDDDLITLFWTRDSPHFRYDAVDDVDPRLPWVKNPAGALHEYLTAQRELPGDAKFENALKLEGGREARDPRADLLAISLTPDEITGLRTLTEEDGARDLVLQVVEILMSVVADSKDTVETKNLLAILERVIEISVEARHFERAAVTLESLGDLAAKNPHLAMALQQAEQHFIEPRQIKMLVEAVSPAVPVPVDEAHLFQYLVRLSKRAVMPLTEAMGIVADRKARKVFCEAIAFLTREDISALATASRDGRWFVARNIAYILGMTKNPDALKILRPLASHSNDKVRVEAVRSAAQFGVAARELMHSALGDADHAVRMLALDLIPAMADNSTVTLLIGRLQSPDFDGHDLAEKKALCAALARVARDHALNPLSQVLVRKSGLLVGSKEESRHAAAAGIALLGTETAIGYLRQGAQSGDPALAAICLQALREARAE